MYLQYPKELGTASVRNSPSCIRNSMMSCHYRKSSRSHTSRRLLPRSNSGQIYMIRLIGQRSMSITAVAQGRLNPSPSVFLFPLKCCPCSNQPCHDSTPGLQGIERRRQAFHVTVAQEGQFKLRRECDMDDAICSNLPAARALFLYKIPHVDGTI